MVRSNDALVSFLNEHPVTNTQQLGAAVVFAESMVNELSAVLEEWELIVQELQALKQRSEAESN